MKGCSKAIALILFLMNQNSYAEPWFTGPLLAYTGQTVPRGHINGNLSFSNAQITNVYSSSWQLQPTPTANSAQISPQFAYGLTDHMDLQLNGAYFINQFNRANYEHISDTSIMLGYQALTQPKNNLWPDLRITLQEILPTGLYDKFSLSKSGTEATGLGSYQEIIGFNFQYLTHIHDAHYLNSFLNVTYTHAGTVTINGLSSYGGTTLTHGRIAPGDSISTDIAGELTLTQNWVAVMEANVIFQQGTKFKGTVGDPSLDVDPITSLSYQQFPTRHNRGGSPNLNGGSLSEISLAPAMEYNFSVNYGVIMGVWFTVAGRNTPAFVTPMFQFNGFW